MKIIITCSAGGHYVEATKACAKIFDKGFDLLYVTYKSEHSKGLFVNNRVRYITHPRHGNILRRLFLFMINGFQSFFLILKERPNVIVSTGADVTVFLMIWGKIFGSKLIFIETGASISGSSLSGALAYKISDLFLVQWEQQLIRYPKAVYGGPLL